jgi:hypothetical protein
MADCVGHAKVSVSGRRSFSASVLFGITTVAAFSQASSGQIEVQQGGCGIIIPGPPVLHGTVATATGAQTDITHHAQQDGSDPTHAFDAKTGQNLQWDPDKFSWVDVNSGQALGVDGRRTNDGTVIPGPPPLHGTVATLTGAQTDITHHAEQDPSDPTRAFDNKTGQNLQWNPEEFTWVDVKTGESVGVDGRCVSPPPANAPQTPPSPRPPPAINPPPTTTTTKPAPPSPSQTSMSTTGSGIQFQLRGIGGASFINGNTPSTAGFDGAVLFPLGNRVLVGPTAGFQWVDSSIVNSIGSMSAGSTFIDTSAGFKNGNFGGRIGFPFGGWQLSVQGGASINWSSLIQASGFCGLGNATSPAGCTTSSTTTTHDTIVGPFAGGYISHSVFSHVGVFAGYDYSRLTITLPSSGSSTPTSSQTTLDLNRNTIDFGIEFTLHKYTPNAAYTTD